MGGLDIRKNDTGAHARPRYRTLRSYVNRLLRKHAEPAPTYTDVPQVIIIIVFYTPGSKETRG